MVEIFNAIVNFFRNVGSRLGVDLIAIIAFSVTALILAIALIVSYFSIEAVTNRKVKQINRYLLNNPFVTDENIVEFNRIMKTRIPRSMRYQWQKFMVNRKDKPSTYLSEDNCITKPFRNSMFVQMLKQVKYIVAVVSIFAFAFILGAIPTATTSLVEILLRAGIVPMCMAIVTFVFLSLMSAKRNALLNEVTYNFDEMQHSLDRAVTTFPPFVDYEILFTRKEIVAGIPVLQEYLQQRAEYEQEELERARLSQVEHEKYDFSKLGIKGNLIMDRAMKECEFYLGNRKILLADIDSIQNQKDLITSSYEDKNRGNQRKLRDIKETIERLKEKLNTTTNKIVGNDIIRQQADEVKKQQLVEKEMEEDSNHYNQDIQKLDDQIARKRKEIEDNRKLVESTLINDFKDYSDKIYEELKKIADSHVLEEIQKLRDEKDKLEHELEDREKYIIEKNALYEEKVKENDSYKDIKQVVEQLKKDIIVKDQEIFGANKENESRAKENKMLRAELERVKKDKYHEVYRYFDMDGVEFFYDENGEPYYYNNEGTLTYYQDAEKIKQLKTYRHKDSSSSDNGDGSTVLTENNQPETKPEPQEEQPQQEEQTEVEQPSVEPENVAQTETESLQLSPEELQMLDNLEVEPADEEQPKLEAETEEVEKEPEAEQTVEQPVQDEPKQEEPVETQEQPAENQEQPSEEDTAKENEDETKNEQQNVIRLVLETPDKQESKDETIADKKQIDEQEKSLNEQIAEQNKFLEQQHKELRETIDQAVKTIEANKLEAEKKPRKKSTKSKTAKKSATKKKTTAKKPSAKKTTAKKADAKKSTAKKTQPKAKKVATKPVTEKKPRKPKSKNSFVFNVKKAPKGLEIEGFDLSGFNALLNEAVKQDDQANKNAQNKDQDNQSNGEK